VQGHRLALLHNATLRTCNFEIINEFAKCCTLLTAYIQISDSLFYLLELRANKSLQLIHLSFTDWSLPFTNASSLIINLHNFRWTFSWWLPPDLCKKSPLHCNHRFRFMIPQHTIHIPFSINVVLAPMMARPGNSSSALLEHNFLFSRPSTFTCPSCAFQYGGEITLKLSTFNVFNLRLKRCKRSYFL
jgi:hypothetical protein